MFVLMTEITVLEALGYSVLGLAIVFVALILLMGIIKIQSTLMKKSAKPAAAPAAAAAPAVSAPAAPAAQTSNTAPGSAGEIKLYNVPDKTAAMVMAIVADSLKKPLNELRFKSIKEVK